MNECHNARDEAEEAHADAQKKTAAKDKTFELLESLMKTDLRYAENKVNFDNADLKKIGWHGRRAKGKLLPPGDISGLKVVNKGEGGYVTLKWNKPSKGGRISVYLVEQREKSETGWRLAASSFEREATIKDQKTGTTQEFRVAASNKSGDGNPSNTVVVAF